MKSSVLACCWVAVVLAGCSRAPAPLPEVNRSELTIASEKLTRRGQAAPFTGVMLERYADGALRSRSAVREGRLDGISEGWYPDGRLQVRELFKAGVAEGVRVKWRPDGTKVSEATIVAGKLEGPFRRWHENGALAEELFMTGGQPNGLARAYYPSGCLKSEVLMENGVARTRKTWPDGEHRPELVAVSR